MFEHRTQDWLPFVWLGFAHACFAVHMSTTWLRIIACSVNLEQSCRSSNCCSYIILYLWVIIEEVWISLWPHITMSYAFPLCLLCAGTVMLRFVQCSLPSSRVLAIQTPSCWAGLIKTNQSIHKPPFLEHLWMLVIIYIQSYKIITLMNLVKDSSFVVYFPLCIVFLIKSTFTLTLLFTNPMWNADWFSACYSVIHPLKTFNHRALYMA